MRILFSLSRRGLGVKKNEETPAERHRHPAVINPNPLQLKQHLFMLRDLTRSESWLQISFPECHAPLMWAYMVQFDQSGTCSLGNGAFILALPQSTGCVRNTGPLRDWAKGNNEQQLHTQTQPTHTDRSKMSSRRYCKPFAWKISHPGWENASRICLWTKADLQLVKAGSITAQPIYLVFRLLMVQTFFSLQSTTFRSFSV